MLCLKKNHYDAISKMLRYCSEIILKTYFYNIALKTLRKHFKNMICNIVLKTL